MGTAVGIAHQECCDLKQISSDFPKSDKISISLHYNLHNPSISIVTFGLWFVVLD